MKNKNTATKTAEGFTFTVTGRNMTLVRDILDLCKTAVDVERCASMGDFKIVERDVANVVTLG